MGPFFGFPPLKISRPLHKIIIVEQVEGIRQLVRKTVKAALCRIVQDPIRNLS
jgi:hypothetical protein